MSTLDGIYGTTWLLNGAALDQSFVGMALTLTGSAHNDGAWVVATVLAPTQFTTTVAPVPEVFSSAVVATFAAPGLLSAVPDTMNDWILYAELFAAITILDKQNLDSTALQARLAQEKARIIAARGGRRDQPQQAPMRRPRRGRGFGGFGGAF